MCRNKIKPYSSVRQISGKAPEKRLGVRALRGLALALACLCLPAAPSRAQFGINNVQYKNFKWQVLKTEHFDVYFYEKERSMVLDAAQMSERAYHRYSKMLNFELRRRIPLILYASQADFQQTNVLPDVSEGLQGVNEFLKRRVLLPFTGSWKDFEHVLTHELAHAFQIDIIWPDAATMANPLSYSPPLWFIEGMVEEFSLDGMTPLTEMWLRDAALSGSLMSLEQLSQAPSYRDYRFGHSFWYFIAQRYGGKKIGEILQKTPLFGNVDRAFKSALGVDVKTLSRQWTEDIRKTYLPQIVRFKNPADFSRQLTDHTKEYSNYNVTPALSPDGEQLAFISDRSGYTDIWMTSAIDGRKRKKLVEGQRSPDFESFRFIQTSINWSPDGRYITFVAKSGPEDAVYMYAMYNHKVYKHFKFGLDGILTPSFSPDGEKIVFSGLDGGRSNLYLVDIESAKLTQLTDDQYTQRDPVFSSDGKKIAFTTEYGLGTDMDRLLFGDYRIGILDLESGKYSILPRSFGDNISPQWSPDGSKLAYVSDRTGIPNIFIHDLADGTDYQVTNILTGVAGITELSPCLSWSSKSGRLAFSAFLDSGWDIYVINNPENMMTPWQPDTTYAFDYETEHLNATRQRIDKIKEEIKLFAMQEQPVSEIDSAQLHTETGPASLSDSASSPGAVAQSVMDSLAEGEKERQPESSKEGMADLALKQPPGIEHQPADSLEESKADSLGPALTADSVKVKAEELPPVSFDFDVPKEKIPLPDTSTFSFVKYKPKFTIDYITGSGGYMSNIGLNGGALISISDMLGNQNFIIGANAYGKIQDSDLFFQYMNLERRTDMGFYVQQFRDVYYLSTMAQSDQYYANIWRGAGVIFQRPFNRFRRLEWGLSGFTLSAKTFEQNFYQYYYYGELKEQNVQKLGTRYFYGPDAALVFDNTVYGYTGPVDGGRYRISARHFFGDLSFSETIVDWRKYWLLWRRMTIAVRGIGAARWGKEPQVFYIGGPYTFRGAGYGDIYGTRLILGNSELRFPLIEHIVLGWPVPIHLRGIGGAFFFDMAGAWFPDENFKPFTTNNATFFKLRNAQAAYGFGMRMNLGFLIIRYDFAKSLDYFQNVYYVYDGQLYRGEELIKGRRRGFFSIGSDF